MERRADAYESCRSVDTINRINIIFDYELERLIRSCAVVIQVKSEAGNISS